MRFENLSPAMRAPGLIGLARHLLWHRLLGKSRAQAPGAPVDVVPVDRTLIDAAPGPPRLTWLGHAAVLLQLAGRNVLIDPVNSPRVALFFRRYAPPALPVEELPRIDLLLVTHNHWDHFDPPTLAALDRNCTVIVPLRLGKWFCRRGFARVIELAWWEQVVVDGVRISLVPAQHGSGRRYYDTDRTLWGGYVVEGEGIGVYHAGDTAWCEAFPEIGRRFPNLAAALLPIAGYDPRWLTAYSHTTPEESAEAFLQVGARWMVPIHWGTFQFSDESLREPMERLRSWFQGHPDVAAERLKVLAVGQTLLLG